MNNYYVVLSMTRVNDTELRNIAKTMCSLYDGNLLFLNARNMTLNSMWHELLHHGTAPSGPHQSDIINTPPPPTHPPPPPVRHNKHPLPPPPPPPPVRHNKHPLPVAGCNLTCTQAAPRGRGEGRGGVTSQLPAWRCDLLTARPLVV